MVKVLLGEIAFHIGNGLKGLRVMPVNVLLANIEGGSKDFMG